MSGRRCSLLRLDALGEGRVSCPPRAVFLSSTLRPAGPPCFRYGRLCRETSLCPDDSGPGGLRMLPRGAVQGQMRLLGVSGMAAHCQREMPEQKGHLEPCASDPKPGSALSVSHSSRQVLSSGGGGGEDSERAPPPSLCERAPAAAGPSALTELRFWWVWWGSRLQNQTR